MKPDQPKDGTHLEVQIHPAEIRWGVLYFFLTLRQVRVAVAAVVLAVVFLVFNLVIGPQVVTRLMSRSEYESLVAERMRQGERLQVLIARLAQVRDQTDELHLKMSRIYLAYGLESDEPAGQGGFPFVPEPAPESIYSRTIEQGAVLEARILEQQRVLETFIDEVQTFESAHDDRVSTTPSTSPLRSSNFVLTSPFGSRRSPFTKRIDFHPGIDLAAPVGTPIYAPADGTVVYAGRYPLRLSVSWWRYGNMVALRNGERFITLFGHCDSLEVRSGQRVKQGELIARVGNTGWSTSPHLHYEVRLNNDEGDFEPVDPRIYILDHRWRDEERFLVRARRAPEQRDFEPLPRIIAR